MNSSKAGIALLLAGAGAATLAAATDLNGNGLALNGSDAMFDVTNTVISTCGLAFSDFSGHAITCLGGGSSAPSTEFTRRLLVFTTCPIPPLARRVSVPKRAPSRRSAA